MLLFPGQIISSDDHLIQGENTYLNEGKLIASVTGNLQIIDNQASVVPLNVLSQPKNGDVAIAVVEYITHQKTYLRVVALNGLQCRFQGILRIQDGRGESLNIKQIVKCAVLQMQGGILNLTTVGDGMGIVKIEK